MPASFKQWLKQCIEHVSLFWAGLLAWSAFSASLFYLFSPAFRREQRSVLAGRLAYQQQLHQLGQSSALLRRNIHRLEKGLIMQPRRASFASDYIMETVGTFQRAVQQKSICAAELKWAADVLNFYFDVVTDTAEIAKARSLFGQAWQQLCEDQAEQGCATVGAGSGSVPYPASALPDCPIEFADLHTLYQRRRSVRWFTQQQVDPALVRQAVNAASLAPSACNRQPYRFDLLTRPADAAKVADLAMGTTGFARQIPSLIAVIGDLSCYPAERDRHVIYIDASLATMQLMLALETLGLSTCPINWPDIESREKAIAQTLGLEPYQRVVMLLAIGYADPQGGIAFSQKKTDALLVREVTL
ncbi:nitroreductase family protein [Rheinheimera marina]|uniref:Nitroreductase family protein n=1 Tax=Rheinheimera marina TaxID=1774958 RepID=A0ABV9JRD5_9GAMM